MSPSLEPHDSSGRMLKKEKANPGPAGYDLVITNAIIEDTGPVRCNVGISGTTIAAIVCEPLKGRKTLDARSRILGPGFVNAHAHLDKSNLLSRMKPEEFGKSLEENRELLKRFKRTCKLEEVEERASQVLREMVAQGVTAVRSQVDVDGTAGLVAAQALLGLREKLRPLVHVQLSAFPQEGVLKQGARELIEEALRLGVEVVGGLPAVEEGTEARRKHIDTLFEIATRWDRDLEIQLDESNSPGDFMLPHAVEKALATGYGKRVTFTHCISLSAVEDDAAGKVMDRLARSGASVIVTPSCNLITRFPQGQARRGSNSMTRVKELLSRGVNVAMGTDNIRDIFYPLGTGSMLTEMHVLAVATRMTDAGDAKRLFDMATVAGARILGLDYGAARGRLADLIVLESDSTRGALAGPAIVPHVVKGGRVVSETHCKTQLAG